MPIGIILGMNTDVDDIRRTLDSRSKFFSGDRVNVKGFLGVYGKIMRKCDYYMNDFQPAYDVSLEGAHAGETGTYSADQLELI